MVDFKKLFLLTVLCFNNNLWSADAKPEQKDTAIRDLTSQETVKGASYFVLHGSDERCMRVAGMRKYPLGRCPEHYLVPSRRGDGKDVLTFYSLEKQFLNVVAAVAASDDALTFGRSCVDRTCKPSISYVNISNNLKREGQALAQCYEPAYVRSKEYATELPLSLLTEGDKVTRQKKYLDEVVHQLGHIYDFSNTVVEDTTDGKGNIKTKRLCTFFCCHCDCTWR